MFRTGALAVAILLLSAASGGAQQASPYLPIDDRLMPFVEHLIRSGVITDPDPLTRPLKRASVLAALGAADTARASESVRAMVRNLVDELAPRVNGPTAGLHFYAGPSAGTHSRRDPLREAGPRYVSWQTGMELWAAMGPLVFASEPFFDRRLRRDPDYTGLKNRPLSFRFSNAYVDLQRRFGEITYGSVDRNWGPSGIEGLLVSPSPYSYDHLYVRLGVDRFRLESQLAQLDDVPNAGGVLEHRWWVAHRLLFSIWPWMTAVLGQATLWKGGGPFEQTWFLNPTRVTAFSREQDNLPDSANTLISGDLRFQLPRGVVIQAQGLVDDLNALGAKTLPDRLAGTLAVDVPLNHSASLRGLWTLVSSLTYRTLEGPIMSVARQGVGLGRNFDDYSQWSISGTFAPDRRVVLMPEVTLLLQGEGAIRKPMPPYPNPNYPFLLVGTVERTVRLGFSGRAQAWSGIDIDANAGVHLITNRGNIAGASATRFVGAITVRYRLGGEYHAP